MLSNFEISVVVFGLMFAVWALYTSKNAHQELSWSEFFYWKM